MSADVHDEPLVQLRCLGEFYAILHFLDLFQLTATLFPKFSIEKFETGILECDPFLIDMIIKLIKCISKRPTNLETWEKTLQSLLKSRIHESNEGVNPLESSSFYELSIKAKVQILLALCDWQLDDNPSLRDMLSDNSMVPKLRLAPVGKDRQDNPYYYFDIGGTARLCREVPISQEDTDTRDQDELYSKPITSTWQTVASTLPEFEIFAGTLKSSKNKSEVALLSLLQNNYIPQLQEKLKNKELAQKRLQRLDVDTTNIISSGRARKSIKYSSFFEDHDD